MNTPANSRTQFLLLLILVVGLLCSCGSPTPIAPPASDTSPGPADKVEIVYFHRTPRCYSCVYAEEGAFYTMETYFKDELASGKLTFEVVDLEDKENTAMGKKYGAFTSSLFINTIRDGTDHIEEVTEIWLLLGDDEAFVEAVRSKIEKSLSGIS